MQSLRLVQAGSVRVGGTSEQCALKDGSAGLVKKLVRPKAAEVAP